MKGNNHIKSLIRLLDDPDEQVFSTIRRELISMGPEVISNLESSRCKESLGGLFQSRIDRLIRDIRLKMLGEALKRWKESPDPALLSGLTLVGQYQYPALTEREIDDHVSALSKEIWLELGDNLTALENVKVINHFLFDLSGFEANTDHYYSPHNSYINDVLHTRKGNPLSLSSVYLLVAEKLNLPIKGVDVPGHFMLGYENPLKAYGIEKCSEMLFFINPFNRGIVLGEQELIEFSRRMNPVFDRDLIAACSPVTIVRRSLLNLVNAYSQSDNAGKAEEIKVLIDYLSE